MHTPDGMERDITLVTAALRYEELRTRDALAPPDAPAPESDEVVSGLATSVALSRDEALELLALGEVIARKAGYGRQLGIRTARATGASWSQIGAALGTSKQSAWEAHARWIDDQADQHRERGFEDMDAGWATSARALAGPPEESGGPGASGRS